MYCVYIHPGIETVGKIVDNLRTYFILVHKHDTLSRHAWIGLLLSLDTCNGMDYIDMCSCTFVFTHRHTCTDICTDICTYTHAHSDTNTCKDKDTDTHTHRHMHTHGHTQLTITNPNLWN